MSEVKLTPSSNWKVKGESDPHGETYNCERNQLSMGDLTDDEMANAVFLHGDAKLSVSDLISGVTPPIAYLMAAKERIRWLSRKYDAKQERIAELEAFISTLAIGDLITDHKVEREAFVLLGVEPGE